MEGDVTASNSTEASLFCPAHSSSRIVVPCRTFRTYFFWEILRQGRGSERGRERWRERGGESERATRRERQGEGGWVGGWEEGRPGREGGREGGAERERERGREGEREHHIAITRRSTERFQHHDPSDAWSMICGAATPSLNQFCRVDGLERDALPTG
jgi:hypothetical protein